MTDLDKHFPANGTEPERPEARPAPYYPGMPSSGTPSTGGVPLAAPAPVTSPAPAAPPGAAPPPGTAPPHAPAPVPAPAPAAAPAPAPAPTPDPAPAPAKAAAAPEAVVKGRITIEDQVIEKIATMAALEVEGVAASSTRAAGPASGQSGAPGPAHDNEVSLDLRLAVEYGCAVMDVAKEVKRNVARMVSLMLGLRVAAVDITVEDVRAPARDQAPDGPDGHASGSFPSRP
ncbi:Asp23/Gls24 family envelope stress response protein [Actinomadura sp. SCN-SB]|uniref:Asp23/Gls24 family envelope stress response protein n=1 Tax=Actinomadura sp. SCN-SB TaxID=3373092 RepID=UPI0037513C81